MNKEIKTQQTLVDMTPEEKEFMVLSGAKIKKLCSKYGIDTSLNKKAAVRAIVAVKAVQSEQRKKALAEAKEDAALELGADFSRAIMFWKRVRCINHLSVHDYTDMVTAWKLLKGVLGCVEERPENGVLTLDDSLKSICQKIADIYGTKIDFDAYSDDEMSEYIQNTISEFSVSVFSKKLKKENTEIIKMSMSDLTFNTNSIEFDSTKAVKLVASDVDALDYSADYKQMMRVVESSEDAISRMLQTKGLSSVVINLGDQSDAPEEQQQLDAMKTRIFTEGFTDKATGKHYMFGFQNPSSSRKANFMFVEAKDWDDVLDLWYDITGLENWDGLIKAFSDKSGKVIMSKFLARVSSRGSNSFDLNKLDPELSKLVNAFNVKYVKDTETQVFKDYKTLKAPGILEMVKGESREITDGDGQGIISFTGAAILAAILRRISKNELEYFITEFRKIDLNVHNIKVGSRLDKITKKIPAVFQIRHGSKKGLLVRWNLEAHEETKNYQAIIPESVRKYQDGEWSKQPLEVCNFLKKKGQWVYMNPQFIAALQWDSPNKLNELVRHWAQYEKDSVNNIAKAMEFHNMIKSSDDEENATVASNLVTALRTHESLKNDFQVLKWRKEQYEKFSIDMSIGRVMVHGQYTYMIFDPNYLLNQWFDMHLPVLQSGEFYHNGKECEAALFRSPLIAPFEAKRVQLVNNEEYRYLADTVVFNGFDGAADDMGGGDHDGDTCAVICNDTPDGKLIVDGVRDCGYVVWEHGENAERIEFSIDNLINHLVKSAKVDRTGIITNHATRALDIANHLDSAIKFAKQMGCEGIALYHPSMYGKGLGCNARPCTQMMGEHKVLGMKGFVQCSLTKQGRIAHRDAIKAKLFKAEDVLPSEVEFDNEHGVFNTNSHPFFTFKEIEEKIEYFLGLVEILRLLQGREIDGAKTGIYAEGKSGKDFVDAVKVEITPAQMITRQRVLGREVSVMSQINSYVSLSPLGRIHDVANEATKDILEMLEHGSSKSWLLQGLLTQEEYTIIHQQYSWNGKNYGSLIDILKEFKTEYGRKVGAMSKALSGKERRLGIAALKEAEVENLYTFAEQSHISPEVMAVTAYLATYAKDSKQTEGLTFAWLMFDELMSVFARGNKRFDLFRLPENVESICIEKGVMYVNDKPYRNVRAYDAEIVPIQVINGRPYAMVHKVTDVTVTEDKPVAMPNKAIYTIGAYGFKFHKAGNVDGWKKLVAENKFMVTVNTDEDDRLVMEINGESICAIISKDASDFALIGKTVKIVNKSHYAPNDEIKFDTNSIANLKVMIVTE